jgi:prevent-host-death family protein
MTRSWQLQEAKNKLSEVVDEAQHDGPQIITRRGEEVAVVLSYEDYTRLRRPKQDLVAFFRASPLVGEDMDLERDRSLARPDINL